MSRTIDQWTWDYWLVQQYANLCYGCYFREIYVNNMENLPRNQPVIIASNHQNALIDALAYVYCAKCQPVFLARADVFKGRIMIHFLNFLNIMPIYRMRDGASSVRRNDEVFEKTLSVLKNKLNPLLLFPEGTHGDKRRLRPLKKGIFRIAFMGQEFYKDKPGVKIVPVGLDYSHYQKFRNTLFINFGRPIEVSEYYNLYTGNNNEGIGALREKLAGEIKKLIIDIQTEEYYDLYQGLRIIYNSGMRKKLGIAGRSLRDRFIADKRMISILNKYGESNTDGMNVLAARVSEYFKGLEELNLRDWVLGRDRYPLVTRLLEALVLLILLPIHVLGLINNYIPYKIPDIYTKKIKDPQFHSSFKLVMGMVFFPAYHIILIVLAFVFLWTWWLKLAFILTLPLTGLFSFNYYIRLKKLWAKHRYSRMTRKKKGSIHELKRLRADIVGSMDSIVERVSVNKND
jgi:1-acyl-sn-glycerol-3-phosphate acyltransferase